VLESADRSVLFKHGAKEIAWLNGYGLTFMAKPYAEWTGSSGHLHISLWDPAGDRALFFEDGAQPYGMSQTMRWFLSGMMALQRELALLIAPTINSYKRYAVASWAPVNVCGVETIALRDSGSSATARGCTSRTASPAAT